MKKVLFLANVPAPYMVDFFNLLGKKTNLTVIFEKSHSRERNSNWEKHNFNNFLGIILKGISTSPDTAFSPAVLPYLLKKYDFIFISNPTTPTGIIAILFLKFLKKKYVIESEGAYHNNNKNIKEFIKSLVLSNAWIYFSGNPSNDSYFLKYNPKAKIIRYPFSSVFKKEIVNEEELKNLKKRYRKILFVSKYKKIAIMVGRFIKLKNFDSVIFSWINMPKDYLLILIGEGPELKVYEEIIRNKRLINVKIVPFQNKHEIKKFYIIADLLIHPTTYDVWGLIINEAFSNGLPVLTTTKCLASQVMLKDNFNGNFISFNENLSQRIYNVISSDYLVKKYSLNALKTIKNYTIEKMVKSHLNFIYSTLYE